MSKVVSTKRSRQKEKSKGTGQFGVADADPQELDVRRTRRSTYPALGAPAGTTWKNFVQKYGEKQRTPSLSSQFQTTSTEAMDTDEAQKVTTEIVKVLIEKQEQEKEKVSPMVVDEEEETMATMEEIEQNLKERKQKKEMEEFLASTKQPLDDSVISFKSIDSGVDDRAEMTEENLEDTIVYKDPDKRPGLEEIEFEQTREPEETLTEQLNKKKSVPKMTYVSSDGTESDKKKQSVLEELRKAPQPTYYLPLKGNPLVSECKSLREEITSRGDFMGIVIEVPEWEEKFNTRIYGLDRRYGIIYAIEGKEWGRFVKACNSFLKKNLKRKKKTNQ